MECCKAVSLIHLYAVGELNKEDLGKLQKHIQKCSKCSQIYNEALEVNSYMNDLFEEVEIPDNNFRYNVMRTIEEKNKLIGSRRSIYMRKKIVAAAVAIILIGGSFVPVNGKSLVDTVGKWVNSLKIEKSNGTVIELDSYDSSSYDSSSSDEESKCSTKTDTSIRKSYYSYEEVVKDLGDRFIKSEYIPEGYKEPSFYYQKIENFEEMTILYTNKDDITLIIGIGTSSDELFTKNYYSNNMDPKFKEISIAGYEAAWILLNLPDEKINQSLELFLESDENKKREYNYQIRVAKTENKEQKNFLPEEELIKIAESLIKQIDAKVVE